MNDTKKKNNIEVNVSLNSILASMTKEQKTQMYFALLPHLSNDLYPLPNKKCLVKGCTNRTSEGKFIGDLCVPCYNMLESGKIKSGMTFIHQMNNTIVRNKK